MPQSASQRRSAQRRLAREIHKGMYGSGMPRRTTAGKAYERRVESFSVKVGRTGVTHKQRQFRSFDKAVDFAANLPPNQKSYIVAKGRYRNIDIYGQDLGPASLNGWATNGYYQHYAQDLADKAAEIFKEPPTTYYVRWRQIG
jgi:hypothetical protein